MTVGTSNFKFTRLFQILDELCEEKILNGNDIIVQTGISDYKSKYYKCFDMIAADEQKEYMRAADYMITHAGTGSIIYALKHHKKVIAFPRFMKYREHVDDHQLELVKAFASVGCILYARDKKELCSCIQEIEEFHPSEFHSNTEQFEALLDNIIIDMFR